MVPPGEFLGLMPAWLIVYAATMLSFGAAFVILYFRMFKPILSGKPSGRTDHMVRRIFGAFPYIFGQKKVLESRNIAAAISSLVLVRISAEF